MSFSSRPPCPSTNSVSVRDAIWQGLPSEVEAEQIPDDVREMILAALVGQMLDQVSCVVARPVAVPGVRVGTSAGQQVDEQVLSDEQRRGVDPRPAPVPALDRRREEEVLSHQVAEPLSSALSLRVGVRRERIACTVSWVGLLIIDATLAES